MRVIAFVCSLLMLVATGSAGVAQETANPQIRFALSGSVLSSLPFFVAIDRGYFRDEHVDVKVVPFQGSSLTQLPSLARGDIDLVPVAPAPGLFNLQNGGFDVKLVASVSEAHTGWDGGSWLIVRQDLWDSRAIRNPADLRGKHVDMAAEGSPTEMLTYGVLDRAGLKASDLQLTAAVRLPANFIAALRNHAVDVQAVPEPIASEIQDQGLGHKWLSYADGVPWFQDLYLAASPAFVRDHNPALQRFLRAYLRAIQDVVATGGRWTPYLSSEVAKWSQLPPSTIAQLPGPTYVSPTAAINMESLRRSQELWLRLGLLKDAGVLTDLVDLNTIDAARKSAPRR